MGIHHVAFATRDLPATHAFDAGGDTELEARRERWLGDEDRQAAIEALTATAPPVEPVKEPVFHQGRP